ncbi:MAG TPA: hypothetical protein VKA48_12605, partial [Gammaproteobacteria bacterium]|nr:hypothetical protein [Gammaproteobacteria bacterium]
MAEIHHIPDEIPVRYLRRSKGATIGFALIFALGLAAFFVTLASDPLRAWRDYLANWLFFTSISTGAVIVMAAATVTKSKWNWSVRRVGLAFAAFLPISFVLFLPLLGAAGTLLPWVNGMADDPVVNAKRAYLNLPFLFSRDILGLLVLFGLALYFVYLTVRPDLGLAAEAAGSDEPGRARWRDRLIQGWMGQEAEEVRCDRKMKTLAPGLVLVYAVVFSIIAYDWVMSLAPHWYSTLFGAWFFMGAFWGGAALTAMAVVWVRTRHPDFARLMGPQQRHDLGKLAFAFCVFWGYLFWSQYLVIWYGKLPWEQA